MRPRAEIARDTELPLGVFDRPPADGFVRPWTVGDVAGVLRAIPAEFLTDLKGYSCSGGRRDNKISKDNTWDVQLEAHIYVCTSGTNLDAEVG